MDSDRYVGLISGTSMDGIDAVAVDLAGGRVLVLAATTVPFASELASMLDQVRSDPDHYPVAEMARLDAMFGEALADAALEVISRSDLAPASFAAIGSHGQTLLHRPDGPFPHTLQIGDPWRLAARTGLPVVADFRRADLAVGGQGAPLAPLLHQALFQVGHEDRLVANLGGIANLTLLPAGGGVSGFDTGPANCLLDLWYRRHHRAGRCDLGGAWSAGGQVSPALLASLLDDPYLRLPPPKSTGIEYFTPAWLDRHLALHPRLAAVDIQASLAEFSATTLANAIDRLSGIKPARLIVCGGGVHNDDLIRRLKVRLDGLPVESSARYGLDPDQVEAVLFAWLARQCLHGQTLATGPVTGARSRALLGGVFRPPAAD
ncbi:MAG: anhydro-N-acetylmuramic acid kinase [Wenzhouxiangella sp.]|nr:anhydro-N-acetylmuramic acid kinase [Wenzhouxiangella sp.]MCH8476395.1 anhydro-N-acetylmuramic acid kinase [Wenzhouxiangella sp.]TVR91841.1 MAG: anhydro-N-acetylmuramic acid kinase [Wenzhouxiangellaceae bacterium]